MYFSPTVLSRPLRQSNQVPSFGRFLQADPLGYEDSPNLYAYVGNDPIGRTDPSGAAWATGHMPGAEPTVSQVAIAYIDNHPQFKHLDGYDRGYAIEKVKDFLYGDLSLPGTAASLSNVYSIAQARERYAKTGIVPQITLVGFTQYGPTFGQFRQFNVNRGVLSARAGGWEQAIRDVNQLASMNNLPAPGDLTILTGPPAGWGMAPIQGGVRFFSPTGLQLRVTPGQARIQIPPGFTVGPFFTDRSQFGETVHYDSDGKP